MKKTIWFFPLLFCAFPLSAQTDTVPPVLESHPLTIFYGFECFDTVTIADLLDTVYDNQSPIPLIELGIRKRCWGAGFPENSKEIYMYPGEFTTAEIWARDTSGNTTTVTVPVYLNSLICDPGYYFMAQKPRLFSNELDPIHHVDFHLQAGNDCLGDSVNTHFNSEDTGYFGGFGYVCPIGYTSRVEPSKNEDPLNGVTTLDLTLISKHILGIAPLENPYAIIAADANQDGKVSVFDIVILRKLILGIVNELPNGKSWQFIPKNYVFPAPDNPFAPPFPLEISLPLTQPASNFEFIGVKIGDVNFSADPNQ